VVLALMGWSPHVLACASEPELNLHYPFMEGIFHVTGYDFKHHVPYYGRANVTLNSDERSFAFVRTVNGTRLQGTAKVKPWGCGSYLLQVRYTDGDQPGDPEILTCAVAALFDNNPHFVCHGSFDHDRTAMTDVLETYAYDAKASRQER
jgi:hypothetical protein